MWNKICLVYSILNVVFAIATLDVFAGLGWFVATGYWLKELEVL